MALIIDPDNLNQGSSLAVASAVFATGTGADIRIHTSASNLLPALAAGEFFEVRDHSTPGNNGLYQVVTVNTSTDDYECDKVTGIAPVTAGAEAITTLNPVRLRGHREHDPCRLAVGQVFHVFAEEGLVQAVPGRPALGRTATLVARHPLSAVQGGDQIVIGCGGFVPIQRGKIQP